MNSNELKEIVAGGETSTVQFKRHLDSMDGIAAVLTDIRQLAMEVVPLGSEAWLYGSRARGTAHPHSDWDILLILNKEKLTQSDYDNVSYPFVLLGCELGEEINPIMYTESEWQSYRATPFYENVQHEAVNLLQ